MKIYCNANFWKTLQGSYNKAMRHMVLIIWDQNPLPEKLKANHVHYLLLALDGDLAIDQ